MEVEPNPSPFSEFHSLLENPETPIDETQKYLDDFIRNECFISEKINWQTLMIESQTIQKPNCAKPIKEGELCFECMDCGLMKENHVYCEECFRNSNHMNHRIKYRNMIWGYCDCGDENMILKSGFCASHLSEKIDEKALRKRIPKIMRKKLRDLLYLLFSEGLHTLENQEMSHEIEINFKNNNFFNCLLGLLSGMVDDSLCFLMFLSHLFQKQINQIKNKNFEKEFYHTCTDYSGFAFQKEKTTCQCSIINFIFKFNQVLPAKIRDQIVSLIFKLSPSYSLKELVVYLMQKNVYFIIELKNTEQDNLVDSNKKTLISELTKLNLFYLVDKELAKKFVLSEHFPITLAKIKNEYDLQQTHHSHDEISTSIRNTLQYYLWKLVNLEGANYLLYENNEAFYHLLCIILTKSKRTQFYDDKREISGLQTNYAFFLIIKKMLKIANDAVNEEKLEENINKTFTKVVPSIFKCCEQERDSLIFLRDQDKLNEDMNYVNNVSTKIFSLMIGYYLHKFSFNFKKLNEFLIEILEKNNIDKEDFVNSLAKEVILSLYSKFLMNVLEDTNGGRKYLTNHNYTTSGLCFEAFDRFSLKILFVLEFGHLSSESFIKFILITINSNFKFSNIDDINYDQESLKNELSALNFVFEILIIILVDSISLINTLNSTKSLKLAETNENSNYIRNELEFIVASLHALDPTFSSKQIKQILTKFKKKEIEICVEKIATFNENNHSYELKPEYKNCFDLNLFSEHSSIYQQMYEITKNRSKGEFSMILGNRNLKYYENPIFTKIISKLIKPEFLTFFFEIFTSNHFDKTLEKFEVSRKALKILYVFLQIQEKNQNEERNLFFNWCEKFDMRKHLDELLIKYTEKSDYVIALKKIIEIFDSIVLNSQEKKIILTKSDKSAKNLFEEKKLKILQEFKQKRVNFIDKIEEIQENISISKNQSSDEEVCSFCLQNTVKKEDVLYITAYISNDNISDFLISDDLLKKDSDLCLTSCTHLVHRECHLLKIQKNNSYFNMRKFFKSDMEFICNYCKSLSNLTIPLVEPFCRSPDLLNFQEIFKNTNELETLDNFLKNNSLKSENEHFFNLAYRHLFEAFYNDIACALAYMDETKERRLFDVLFRISLDYFEKVFYKDLFSFIAADYKLLKNLFQLALFNFMEKGLYLKNDLQFLIQKIMVPKNILNDLSNYHRDFLRVLLLLRFALNSDEKLLIMQIKFHAQNFISNILILCYFLYNPEGNEITQEKIREFFQNEEIKSKTFAFISPFYSMIIGFLLTCFKIDSNLKNQIDVFAKGEKDLENTNLFRDFFKILEPKPEIMQKSIESWANLISQFTLAEKNELKLLISKLSKNPNKLEICEIKSYDDLIVRFMSRRCSICKFYPAKYGQKLFLCLVCNNLLCDGVCHDKFIGVGNLTFHAKNYHENKTVYLNMSDGSLIIMSLPSVLQEKSIFVDKHGQLLNLSDKKYSDFLLDKKRTNKWVQALLNKRLHQEVFNLISVDPQALIENPNWKSL